MRFIITCPKCGGTDCSASKPENDWMSNESDADVIMLCHDCNYKECR